MTVVNEEMTEIPEGPTIIATGPLTSQALSAKLQEIMDEEYCIFMMQLRQSLKETALIWIRYI